MWSIEDVLSELSEVEEGRREKGGGRRGGLAPGFRFHPTDEELISYYLASKVFNNNHPSSSSSPHHFPLSLSTINSSCFLPFPGLDIPQVDLNRIEPWDLPEGGKMGEREWYFYSVRDRKYPTGLRTNRATGSGYWKATGKDKHVYASSSSSNNNNNKGGNEIGGGLIGMKKTLVFYQGRAPRGHKTPWVMHEYRLDGLFSSFRLSSSKEEWVICRIFHKHGVGGNENKRAIKSSFNYNTNNNLMMINSSSLPPLLDTPTPTPTTAPAAFPPPLSSTLFDDFLPPLNTIHSLPSIATISHDALTMKQEQQHHQNWLEKIISPQHQLFNNPPQVFHHHHHPNPGLGFCLDDDNLKFNGDFLQITNNIDHLPGATTELSAASLAALDRLLDNHPPINLA